MALMPDGTVRCRALEGSIFSIISVFLLTPIHIYELVRDGPTHLWMELVYLEMVLLGTGFVAGRWYGHGTNAGAEALLGLLLILCIWRWLSLRLWKWAAFPLEGLWNRMARNVAWIVTSWWEVALVVLAPFAFAYPSWVWQLQVWWMFGLWFLMALIGARRAHAVPIGANAGTLVRGTTVAEAPRRKQRVARHQGEIAFGSLWIAPYAETEHFLIAGKTGSGKTQAINAMLRVVRERGQPAIVADAAGGFLARFGRQGDIILNPFDARSVTWSPFVEIEQSYDCLRIAKAVIPDEEGEAKQWNLYAQTLFSEVLKALWQRGEHSTQRLVYLVTGADVSELAPLVEGTPAAAAIRTREMVASTRAVAGMYLTPWYEVLKDEGLRPPFSIRKWARRAARGEDKWLFLTYRDDQLATLRYLVAGWLELAIVEVLAAREEPDRRVWFVMDELDALGKVSSLRAGLTRLRKYGGACIAGLQTIAQLRDTYGRNEAQTLLSCLSTKLILAPGDGETAQYFEQEIGEREIDRAEAGHGMNWHDRQWGTGQSDNVSVHRVREPAVLASELQGLPNLQGFLKQPGQAVFRLGLDYVDMPQITPPFRRK